MNTDALLNQVGGTHYVKRQYQPIQFISKLRLSFSQGSIIKYVTRYKDKNGVEDLKKALHYCTLAYQVTDYSVIRAKWFSIWRRKTDFEIAKYTKCNELIGIAESCIKNTVYANFHEAEIDLLLMINQEYGHNSI